MIRTVKITDQKHEVYFNSTFLGTFELDIDGTFCYKNIISNQHNSSYSLRLIADALDRLNKPFDDGFTRYFEDRARDEYNQVLNETGKFFVWHPNLTGDYEKDKSEWLEIYKKLEDLRVNNIAF